MDYGHPLRFGTFLTPASDDPGAPVELAALSEELAFDLVTFQDHPYQPRFLDTWTLLSYVAARTERIHLAANVLNVPLRPAPVLARAAANLDLLSGGRVELGLGAGAAPYRDAARAMGAEPLTPAEAVDALEEAIEVIRGLWAGADRSPLRYSGDHYRLDGAERGPAPAHTVPIWIGALRPRMLRLIGRAGDGWLPTLRFLPPGGLADGNAIIDSAAEEAGRDPREIRRLLNIDPFDGPGDQWAARLLPLAVDHGVGTFILMSDDPATMTRFAREVVPALREAVDAERSARGVRTGTVPSLFVRERRHRGIDYDAVPASLKDLAVEPGDAAYASVRSNYLRGGSPGLVLRPRTPAEVADALAYARTQPVKLSIRSGGHGISGRSTNHGGIIIDVGALNAVEVLDKDTRRVRIGPGARWRDVAAALAPHGWALTSGDYGGVGVGGLATAGGIGWLVREHGLTLDHLRAAELVLADGSHVRASETENPDLFWAVRGAGANFGIVTSFEFEVDEVGDVAFGQFVFDASDTAGFLRRWGAAMEAAPRDTTTSVIMGAPRPGMPPIAQVMGVVDSDDPETVVQRLKPIAETAPLLDYSIEIKPYAAVMDAPPSTHEAQGEPVTRAGLADHLTPELAEAAAALVRGGQVYFFQIRSMGGASADVPADATAFAGRSANFQMSAFGANRQRLNRAWEALSPHLSGTYLNFETDTRPERLLEAWPPETLRRLRELKRRYDPDNVFRDNFNIRPGDGD
ncbi:hypothetical protein Acsp03_53260 [Actinomadura sp. NBRC 104412]|uniref:LLM class flavin-dependent oxidoreductase n=1 Tax=Actinomadura sp. NBRC 104412 TaxID=3032203 RepID=UPI0024A5C8BB|nr:hypothetical protein Acsp03_53260 [Actinomadura sp. NBRC 104412]